MDQQSGFKAVIIGASGAVGRELVQELCKSPKWSKIHLIVRRQLDAWKTIEGYEKLSYQKMDTFDPLEQTNNWDIFQGYNTFFCLLGSRVKEGDDQFVKVDYTYPLYCGKIAQKFNIKHYSLVSSTGADSKSMFLYMRTKGKVEQSLKDLQIPYLSIFRPGAILNRENDSRFGETVLKYMPFIGKIETKDLAKAIRIEAETINQQNIEKFEKIYENKDILNLLK